LSGEPQLPAYSVEKLHGKILLKYSRALETLKFERAEGPLDSGRNLASVDLNTPDRVFMPGFPPQVDSGTKSSVPRKLVCQQNRPIGDG
jgi:hypothetical protein